MAVKISIKITRSEFPYGTVFSVSLTASDVAVSQLGQFALYDGRNNSLIASVNIPVVYPVATNAILFDSKRNRLYLTTGASTTLCYPAPPSKPNPRFHPNSQVSIDVTTGLKTMIYESAGRAKWWRLACQRRDG